MDLSYACRPHRLTPRAGALIGAAGIALVVTAAAGFLDPLSLLITLGGALAVTGVTFAPARLRSTCRQLAEALGDESDLEAIITAFKRLARVHRAEGIPGLERATRALPDPFVRRAVTLSVDARDADELGETLLGEARRCLAEGEAARHVLLTVGKLCPAFGLIGTLVGLVLLLRSLTGNDLASTSAALGVAVQTTLYGVILSNVVVLPLATKLHAHLAQRALIFQMVVEGTVLLHRDEHPTRIERTLRAYLADDGRGGGAGSAPRLVKHAA
jgi:chemotaxis protein MotA